MKIEIETETPEEAVYLSEMVHFTDDQKRLIFVALSDYFHKMCDYNRLHDELFPDEDPYFVNQTIEVTMMHECQNIYHKLGAVFGSGKPIEKPSYFSVAPNEGETPEEFCERTWPRRWLEFDEDDDDEKMSEV